ncbi:hypothetical protein [Desulfocurvus sp. DL9XJH121]
MSASSAPYSERPAQGLVLLAERNSRIRSFLAREFQGRGVRVAELADGRDLARALAEAPGPGVVVLDLEIAHLDAGLEALQRAADSWRLVIHALMPDHNGHPAMELAEAVVEKGADPGKLLLAVAALAAYASGAGEDGEGAA